MGKRRFPLTIFIWLLLLTSIVVWPVYADSPFQKGICYSTWQSQRYMSADSDKSLEKLARTGARWVAIIATYYQDDFNSHRIYPTQKTPSDKSLMHVINRAHRLGLKVMLKPHIDLIDNSDGLWRADIGFQTQEKWRQWFSQYLRFILHYARLAERAEVELLCIGTELCFASSQTEFWQEYIIPRIRKAYSGKLIYAANWDEYRSVKFWEALDYVGIDAYFPLTQKSNPEYEEIRECWMQLADEIQVWQSRINKPVIFTEIGYRSCEYAASSPWEYSSSQPLNLEIQADCYRAALSTLLGRSWCHGVYWWYWKSFSKAGGIYNRDFTPQNKPAERILTYWYKKPYFAQIP